MFKKNICNNDMNEMFNSSAKDIIYRFIMADGMIRGAVVQSTRLVNEMRANHETGPLETLILGQAYIASILISSGLKGENERVSISIQCSGPVKGLDVEANVQGEVRGYLKTSKIEIENSEKNISMPTIFGAGFLSVTRYLESAKGSYSGQVALEHGSIAEDLANYFLVSEQIPTGFRLSVFFNDQEEVEGAGGIYLQAMPGAGAAEIREAEKLLQDIDSLGELFANGQAPEKIIQEKFSSLEPKLLNSNLVEFLCRCSKDRMAGYLRNLPLEERKDILKNGPFPMVIKCHHCNSEYEFSKADLTNLEV